MELAGKLYHLPKSCISYGVEQHYLEGSEYDYRVWGKGIKLRVPAE